MSHHQDEDSVPKGNEWEVVALTESTYAASPGPTKEGIAPESSTIGPENPETAQAMFMSGHFGFPSEQENVPQERDRDLPSPNVEKTDKLGSKNDEDINIEKLISGEFSGEKKATDEVSNISLYSSDFGDDVVCSNLMDKEQGIFDTGKSGSFSGAKESAITESIESLDRSTDDSEIISDMPKNIEGHEFNDSSPDDTWWRKHALSLYEQAKNVSPVWSIVVAAAVVGLVIVGYRWQRDKQHIVQQLKPCLAADDEGPRWIMGPAARVAALGARSSQRMGMFSAAEHQSFR